MSLRAEQRRILGAVGSLADAHAEAVAAIGLTGDEARRAMRRERRLRSRVRFERIAARVPGNPLTTEELQASEIWPDAS